MDERLCTICSNYVNNKRGKNAEPSAGAKAQTHSKKYRGKNNAGGVSGAPASISLENFEMTYSGPTTSHETFMFPSGMFTIFPFGHIRDSRKMALK